MILDTKFRGLSARPQEALSLSSNSAAITAKARKHSTSVAGRPAPAITKEAGEVLIKKETGLTAKKVVNGFARDYKTIGIVVPDIINHFFSGVIAGVEKMAASEKYTTIICQSGEQMEREKAAVQTLIDRNVACIIISLSAETAATQNTGHLKNAIGQNVKVIQFDRVDNALKTDCVVNDVDSVIKNILEHFVGEGFNNIACLAGPQKIDIFRKRKEAFEKYVRKMGLPSSRQNIAYYDLSRESANEAARKLLSLKNRPDAIIACTDLGALGIWDIAGEMGLKIPNDLGLCGFSNADYTELVSPNITSADQRSFEIGRNAARIFFESLDNEAGKQFQTQTMVIDPLLIIRASSKRTGTTP